MKRWIVLVLLTLAFGLGDGVFAQTTDGTDERAAIEAAQQLLNDGLITEALDAFRLILRERPDDVDALIGRSTALSRLNRPRLAIADGLQAVKLAPQNSQAYLALGLGYTINSEYDLAQASYEKAERLAPQSPIVHIYWAEWHLLQADADAAIASYTRAIDLEPANLVFRTYRAQVYQYIGQTENALTDYEGMIALEPDNPSIYFSRALLYAELGEHELSVADNTKVVELDPERAGGFLNRGYSYYLLGDMENASADYYRWATLTETETFELEPIQDDSADLALRMEQGWVYRIPYSVDRATRIQAEIYSPRNNVDPVLIILDADGVPIFVNDDGGEQMAVNVERYTLPAIGDYTLVITHAGGGSEGRIVFKLEAEPAIGNA